MPACVARLTNWLGLQTKLGLDDGADKKATTLQMSAADAPHVNYVAGPPQEEWRFWRAVVWRNENQRAALEKCETEAVMASRYSLGRVLLSQL